MQGAFGPSIPYDSQNTGSAVGGPASLGPGVSYLPSMVRAVASHGVPDGTTFIWEQAENRLDAQLRQADALDTKAGALVGLHALAAGLISTSTGRLSGPSRWVAVGSIVGLATSGLIAFGAFRTAAYTRSPAPEEMWRFGEWPAEDIQLRFLSTRFDALDANGVILQRKARLIGWSLAGLAVIALSVAITAVIDLVRSP